MDVYDLNIRKSIHTVEVHFQCDDFHHKRTVTIYGNTSGLSIIESACDVAVDYLIEHLEKTPNDAFLLRANGDELIWDDVNTLDALIVGVEIIGHKAATPEKTHARKAKK